MSRRSAFTVLELLIVIAIATILLALLLPMAERVRHQGYIDKCASNLRTIGQAMTIYAVENHGQYPRTAYAPGATPCVDSGKSASDPFASGGPSPNDITAAIYLLHRAERLPANLMYCPYDDVFEYQPDLADPQTHSNFTDAKLNLGYSFANMYPDTAAVQSGYQWSSKLGSTFAIASDINPGTDQPHDNVLGVTIHCSPSDMKQGNSNNHEKDGQNVLYGDGHVIFSRTPFCGPNEDNIFTIQNPALTTVVGSPANKNDCVLLPTDD